MGVNRTHRDRKTDGTFAVIGQALGDVEVALADMSMQMGMMTTPSITIPEPALPFKIAERIALEGEGIGAIITIAVAIPQEAEQIRVVLIRKSQNAILAGETEAQARTRAIRQAKRLTGRILVNEDEAASGRVEAEFPIALKPKQDGDEDELQNAYQLIRLIALNDTGAFGKNPEANPFDPAGPFPFPALTVRNDAMLTTEQQQYFLIGEPLSGTPSKPMDFLIISNMANLETQAPDAEVKVLIWADGDNNNRNFIETGAQEIIAVFRPFDDVIVPGDASMNGPLQFSTTIDDRNLKFVILKAMFPLGRRYLWVKNLAKNVSGKVKATADMNVDFYAGGNIGTTGLPEFDPTQPGAGSFSIATIQQDTTSTLVIVTIHQRSGIDPATNENYTPILLKRLQIFKTNPNGVRRLQQKYNLLDEEALFVTNATVFFTYEVKHNASKIGIRFDAQITGVGHTTAMPLQRMASPAMGNSTLSIKPTQPSLTGNFGLMTGSDGDTANESDAYADFTVGANIANPLRTFGDELIDHVAIALRKTNGASDDDFDDNTIPKTLFPVEDLTQTKLTFRVRNLKLGRKYVWRRNLIISQGAVGVSDPVAPVIFRAGKMIMDPANVGLSFVIQVINENHSRAFITITQPTIPTPPETATMACLLKNVQLHMMQPPDAGFTEIARQRLQDNADISSPGQQTTIDFRFPHKKQTANISLFVKLVAVGNASKQTASQSFTSLIGMPPESLPANPMSGDITTGIDLTTSDPTLVDVFAEVSVFAHTNRTSTFRTVKADTAIVKIVELNDANIERYTGIAVIDDANLDLASVKVRVPGLVFNHDYKLRKVITSRQGITAESGAVNIQFRAGGNNNINLLTAAFTTMEAVDSHSTIAKLMITQPSAIGGGPIMFKSIIFEKARISNSVTGVPFADQTFKEYERISVKNDAAIFIPSASKTYTSDVKHAKDNNIQVRARIVGFNIGQTQVERIIGPMSMTTGGNEEFMDTGAPGLVTGGIVRFKQNGLQVKFAPPTTGMNTYVKTELRFFRTATNTFWDPSNPTVTSVGTPIDVPCGRTGFTYPIRKRDIPAAFLSAIGQAFTVFVRVTNQFAASPTTSTTLGPFLYETITDKQDVSGTLYSNSNLCPNGDFTFKANSTASPNAPLKAWFNTLADSDNETLTNITDASLGGGNGNRWQILDNSLLVKGVSAYGRLGRKIPPSEMLALSFLAKSGNFVTTPMSLLISIVSAAGAVLSQVSVVDSVMSGVYQFYGAVFNPVGNIGDRKYIQFQDITGGAAGVIIDKIMLVRGMQPVAFSPKSMTETNFDGSENFDSGVGGGGSIIDLGTPSSTEDGWFLPGTGGKVTIIN